MLILIHFHGYTYKFTCVTYKFIVEIPRNS
jgi:hypothetical protein